MMKRYPVDINKKTAADLMSDFQTPPEVANYMASLIPVNSKTVLEPTPGLGNLVRAAEARGFTVYGPLDFFLLKKTDRYDCIIMNPPFSSRFAFLENAPDDFKHSGMKLGYKILFHCLNQCDSVIALMPWFLLTDSDKRVRSLKDFGLVSLTALPRKTFQYARIQTVVLELRRGFAGDTVYKIFDRIDQAQQKLFL